MIDALLLSTALAAFQPPACPSTAEYAATSIVLTGEMASKPGPLRFSRMQRLAAEAIDDPAAPVVVLCWASQTGKSTLIDASLLRSIEVSPGPMMLVHPTDAKGKDYVRSRLDPLISANENIRALIGKDISNRNKPGSGGNGIVFKSFPGGSLSVASAHKAEDLAARAIARLYLDEVDRYPASAGREGDPVMLAFRRTLTYARRKIVLTSTPTATGASRIWTWFQKGSQERYAIPCPACGAFFVPTFESLKWEEGRPATARLECSHCGERMTNAQRLRALDKGEFQTTNPNPEAGIRSLHASGFCSYDYSLADLAKEWEAATSPAAKRVFVNTILSEPYDPGSEAENDPGDLQARAIELTAPYPKDIQFITAGADVQGNRIEVTFLAHAPKRKFVLDHVIIGGDPTGSQVWEDLARLLRTTFQTVDGRSIPIAMTFIDSGYLSTNVQTFALRHPRVQATFGRRGWERPPVREGHRIQGTPKRTLVLGIDQMKLNVAKALQADSAKEGHIVLPAHLTADYFEQLAAERLTVKHVRGFPVQSWDKDPATRNEAFDCLIYASLAATLVKRALKATTDKQPSIGELAAALKRDGQTGERTPATNVIRMH